MTRAPASRPRVIAASTRLQAVPPAERGRRPPEQRGRDARSTPRAVTVALAPAARTIWFCPVASIVMIATPVGDGVVRRRTPPMSTPAPDRLAARSSPVGVARRRAPIMATRAPRRAAAQAWLAPLPSGEDGEVAPGHGLAGARETVHAHDEVGVQAPDHHDVVVSRGPLSPRSSVVIGQDRSDDHGPGHQALRRLLGPGLGEAAPEDRDDRAPRGTSRRPSLVLP